MVVTIAINGEHTILTVNKLSIKTCLTGVLLSLVLSDWLISWTQIWNKFATTKVTSTISSSLWLNIAIIVLQIDEAWRMIIPQYGGEKARKGISYIRVVRVQYLLDTLSQ